MSHRRPLIFQGSGRGRQAAARDGAGRRDQTAAAAAELPDYEPLEHPLTARAQRSLADLSATRDTRKYEQHLDRCARYLRTNVAAVNDLLGERRAEFEAASARRRREATAAAQRREDEGEEDRPAASQEPVDDEETVGALEADVARLTGELEAAARAVIDLQAGLQDDLAAIAALKTQVAVEHMAQARATRNAHGAGDTDTGGAQDAGDDEASIVRTREILEAERTTRIDAYASLSMYEKYCRHNDYISFKKTLQDATNPEVPVPDPENWFDEQGEPILAARSRGGEPSQDGADDDVDDEDEDLVVTREVESFRCPLTLAMLVEPYSNHKCRHTFERKAILDYIRSSRGKVKCPVGGCDQDLTAKDFYMDEVMLRKLKRAEKAAAADVDPSSDVDAEELVQQSQRTTYGR